MRKPKNIFRSTESLLLPTEFCYRVLVCWRVYNSNQYLAIICSLEVECFGVLCYFFFKNNEDAALCCLWLASYVPFSSEPQSSRFTFLFLVFNLEKNSFLLLLLLFPCLREAILTATTSNFSWPLVTPLVKSALLDYSSLTDGHALSEITAFTPWSCPQ